MPSFIISNKLPQASCLVLQEENKKLKSKQREKMQPKMGKLDIDYQVLHDAFFKFQTKPQLTVMGDLYYEGKEYEARVGPFSLLCPRTQANFPSGILSSVVYSAGQVQILVPWLRRSRKSFCCIK